MADLELIQESLEAHLTGKGLLGTYKGSPTKPFNFLSTDEVLGLRATTGGFDPTTNQHTDRWFFGRVFLIQGNRQQAGSFKGLALINDLILAIDAWGKECAPGVKECKGYLKRQSNRQDERIAASLKSLDTLPLNEANQNPVTSNWICEVFVGFEIVYR